jgi:lysophospholipase L1-like esterase
MQKNKRTIYLIFRNTIILLIILECALGIYFSFKDTYSKSEKTETIVNSDLYPDLDKNSVKVMFSELYSQEMQWSSYTHYRFKHFKGKFNTINTDGQRKTVNFNKSSNKKTFKIFCFGGSTLYGSGARDEFTIPSMISKFLHKSFPDQPIEVFNFGCHGYIRAMENIALQKELLNGHVPDLVIFYDGVNDVVSAFQNNEAGQPSNALNRINEFNMGLTYSNRLHFMLTKTNIYNALKKLASPSFVTSQSSEKLSQSIATNYYENVKITKALSEAYNFKVLNFIQPQLFSKKNKIGIEITAVKETSYYNSLFSKTYSLFSNSTSEFSDQIINLKTVLNPYQEPFYLDFCHINERGNKIVAQEIFKTIKDSLLKTPPNEN